MNCGATTLAMTFTPATFVETGRIDTASDKYPHEEVEFPVHLKLYWEARNLMTNATCRGYAGPYDFLAPPRGL